VRVIRPLIDIPKSDLIQYAKTRNLQWQEDESNDWLDYTRNKIRHNLIPSLEEEFSPSVKDNVQRITKFLQGADEFIQERVSEVSDLIISRETPENYKTKINILNSNNQFIQGEIISRFLKTDLDIPQVNYSQIEGILNLKDKETGSIFAIDKFWTCIKDRKDLLFRKNLSTILINQQIEKVGEYVFGNKKLILKEVPKNEVIMNTDKSVEFFDFDKFPLIITLRNWQEGDVIKPLPSTGRMKVSDFLINNKVNTFDKNFVYVLAKESEVIWVLNYQINDKFKITETTTRFLKGKIEDIKI
jgi:tRNA(Ile)-lysidine synthase